MRLDACIWPAAVVLVLLLCSPSVTVTAWTLFGQPSSQESCNCGDMVYGQRIPRSYFEVSGFGETNEGAGTDPYETGAHDLAMEDAGIHMFNLVTYTSMLPPEAKKLRFEDAAKSFHHGAVLECILSEVYGSRGDRITAGVGIVMVHAKAEAEGSGGPVGGFAVEYNGHASRELAQKELRDSLDDLFDRRFGLRDHEMEEPRYTIATHTVSQSFGAAMAGVCFTDYIFPVVKGGSVGEQQQK